MVFGLKKVKVGGPINFRQWNLDQQVRGLRLEVDKDNDLIALPVISVNPASDQTVSNASALIVRGYVAWGGGPGNVDVLVPRDPTKDIYLLQLQIVPAGLSLAVPAIHRLDIRDKANPPINRYFLHTWLPAVPDYMEPVVINFPCPGIRFPFGVNAYTASAPDTGYYAIQAWGYEA